MTKSAAQALKTITWWANSIDEGKGRNYATLDLLSAAKVLEAELKRLRSGRDKWEKKYKELHRHHWGYSGDYMDMNTSSEFPKPTKPRPKGAR